MLHTSPKNRNPVTYLEFIIRIISFWLLNTEDTKALRKSWRITLNYPSLTYKQSGNKKEFLKK